MPALLRSADVWCRPPGTSRSASCRWRRWRVAAQWSARQSAGCWTPCSRTSPACWCRHATPQRSRGRTHPARRPGPAGAFGAAASRWPYALRLEPHRRRHRGGLRRGRGGSRSRRLRVGGGAVSTERWLTEHARSCAPARGCTPTRPRRVVGAAARAVARHRRPAPGGGQRRQRRRGPAPHLRAGRPLRRRARPMSAIA
jgi:hypothetical protein